MAIARGVSPQLDQLKDTYFSLPSVLTQVCASATMLQHIIGCVWRIQFDCCFN